MDGNDGVGFFSTSYSNKEGPPLSFETLKAALEEFTKQRDLSMSEVQTVIMPRWYASLRTRRLKRRRHRDKNLRRSEMTGYAY